MANYEKDNRRVLVVLITACISAGVIYLGWKYIPEDMFILVLIVFATAASLLVDFLVRKQKSPKDDQQ